MRLGPLLEGPKQYVVPYFQRAYSWRRRQWTTLFDDILELYELGWYPLGWEENHFQAFRYAPAGGG